MCLWRILYLRPWSAYPNTLWLNLHLRWSIWDFINLTHFFHSWQLLRRMIIIFIVWLSGRPLLIVIFNNFFLLFKHWLFDLGATLWLSLDGWSCFIGIVMWWFACFLNFFDPILNTNTLTSSHISFMFWVKI